MCLFFGLVIWLDSQIVCLLAIMTSTLNSQGNAGALDLVDSG